MSGMNSFRRRALIRAGCLTAGALTGLVGCSSFGTKTDTPIASLAPTPPARPPRVGLALGGGAARGFAHIGVVKVLEAQGFSVDYLAGTSAGSVVASLYASGLHGFDLQQLALKMDESVFADWTLGGRGLFRGEALQAWVNQAVANRPIEQMRIPLGITATDLRSGDPMLFRRGNTGMAVRASSAVPSVFAPVEINGREYVDGGLTAPVPVGQVRAMGAEVVIAVDISSDPSGQSTSSMSELLLQTFTIMGRSINRHELANADVVVRPSLPTKGTDFAARHQAILAGELAMTAALPTLRAQVARWRDNSH